jgi:transposase
MKVTRMGMELATQVFQVHGVARHGKVVIRRQLTRGTMRGFFAQLPACLIGMEACASAHYGARELSQFGHTVRLIAPQFVRPYRKNPKNDGNDAEAICEAVSRPNMRFVPVNSVAQPAVLAVHRARELLVGDRTALVHQMRGLLAAYGIMVPQGMTRLRRALPSVLEDAANGRPALTREVIADLQARLWDLDERIASDDRRIAQLARQHEAAQRLMPLEGVGAATATAIVATMGDGKALRNGRQFAAWLGLVPQHYASGGKTRLGHSRKRGNVYLRTRLLHGARRVLQRTSTRTDAKRRWAEQLKPRRGNNIAAVALAAKHARIIWAILARGQEYRRAASHQRGFTGTRVPT